MVPIKVARRLMFGILLSRTGPRVCGCWRRNSDVRYRHYCVPGGIVRSSFQDVRRMHSARQR